MTHQTIPPIVLGNKLTTDLKRVIWAFWSTGFIQVANFATGILIARTLGADGRGEVAQIMAWFGMIASVTLIGTNDAVVYYLSRYPRSRDSIMTAGWITLIRTMIVGVVLAVLATTLGMRSIAPTAFLGALLFLSYIPGYQAMQITFAYFQASHEVRRFTFLRCLSGATYVTCLIIVHFWPWPNVASVLMAYSLSIWSTVAVGLSFIRYSGGHLTRPRPGIRRRMFNFGRPLIFQRIALVSRDNADRIILPFFITSAALGHYVVAGAVSYLIAIVGLTMEIVAFPSMARIVDMDTRRRKAELFISGSLWLIVLFAGALTILSKPMIVFAFGPGFRDSVAFVPFFILAGAFHAWRVVLLAALKASRRGTVLAKLEVLSACIMLSLLLALPPFFGAFGGAYAQLGTALLACTITIVTTIRELKLSPWRLIVPRRADIQIVHRLLKPIFRRKDRSGNSFEVN